MQFLKNKHLILAMFIAPVLAIIAYFAVDYMVSEEPQVALQGKSYKLVASSNCRYESGACTLTNGDIEIKLRVDEPSNEQAVLKIYSELAIQNIIISMLDEKVTEPLFLNPEKVDKNNWQVKFEIDSPENKKLRFGFNIADSLYYVETTAIFMDYSTAFSRENFSN